MPPATQYDEAMSNYYFKRKRYGYGWTPVTLGGWVIVAVFLVVIVLWSLLMLPSTHTPTTEQGLVYGAGLLTIVVLMWLVTRRYAPPGRWRWGRKPTDNSDEDF